MIKRKQDKSQSVIEMFKAKGFPVCRLLAFCAVVLCAVAFTCPAWFSSSAENEEALTLESQIADATGLKVTKGSARWMTAPIESGLRGALTWYELVFLAKTAPDAPTDLFRLAARTLDGRTIFAARGLKNLSLSPAAEETSIAVAPPLAAAMTRVLGKIRAISVFDFSGAPQSEEKASGLEQLQRQITNLLETGRKEGVGKTTIRFSSAPQSVRFEIKDGALDIHWTDIQGKADTARIRPDGQDAEHPGIIVIPSVHLTKRPVLWAVDTVRSLPFVGPGPIEWLEGRVFAFRDFIRRTRYRILGDTLEAQAPQEEEAAYTQLDLPAGLEIGKRVESETWPPPPFEPPVFSRRISNEGTWSPIAPDFVKHLENAPPAFYKSVVRPDRSRPYVTVELIAMDMRQLELHMAGGIEDPKSTTGSAGDGRIPRKKDLMERTTAAFNGAFKTEHGAYGMMVNRNVLLPPKGDSATAAALDDGTALLGTWPKGAPIPENMSSYRQNMDPLVENGVVNPKRRYLWGFTLEEDITKMQTIRSGLCMSDKGYMVYAWGEDVTARTLGIAMNAAGCSYGLHLDMNPYHTAFIFYRFTMEKDGQRPEYRFESPIPQTMYSPHRYINGAPKDFFFLALKNPSPGPGWSSEGLAQTAPAFLPCVFRKDADGCKMIAVHLNRASVRLSSGDIPGLPEAAKSSLDDAEEQKYLLADIDFGPWNAQRGQLVNGVAASKIPARAALLGVGDAGRPAIIDAGSSAPALQITDAVAGNRFADNALKGKSVIGLGMRGEWLFIAAGDAGDIRKHLTEEGADRLMYFSTDTDKEPAHRILVRDEKGLVNLTGARVMQADMTTTHLQISAVPRPTGARRLETVFPSNAPDDTFNEEKKNDAK